jgi:hypothetical protein
VATFVNNPETNGGVVPASTRTRIALAITGLWALTNVASLVLYSINRPWEPSPWIGATMLGTAAAIFGSDFRKGLGRE